MVVEAMVWSRSRMRIDRAMASMIGLNEMIYTLCCCNKVFIAAR